MTAHMKMVVRLMGVVLVVSTIGFIFPAYAKYCLSASIGVSGSFILTMLYFRKKAVGDVAEEKQKL